MICASDNAEKKEPSFTAGGNALVQPLWKTVGRFLKKLKMTLPFHPVIPHPGIYPKKTETPIRKDICTPMFMAAQFIIPKIWKQPM